MQDLEKVDLMICARALQNALLFSSKHCYAENKQTDCDDVGGQMQDDKDVNKDVSARYCDMQR